MRLDKKIAERRRWKVVSLPKLNEHEYSNILYRAPVIPVQQYVYILEPCAGGRQRFSFRALCW